MTAPLSSLASRLRHVSGSKHEHVQGTRSAYQPSDVSVEHARENMMEYKIKLR